MELLGGGLFQRTFACDIIVVVVVDDVVAIEIVTSRTFQHAPNVHVTKLRLETGE
jgi:hypothetical protein